VKRRHVDRDRAIRIARDRAFALAHGRAIRLGADLGQEAMAAALGVSVPTLSRWERGVVRVPDRHVNAWASLLRELQAARREAVA